MKMRGIEVHESECEHCSTDIVPINCMPVGLTNDNGNLVSYVMVHDLQDE
jgi:hypothetical protein